MEPSMLAHRFVATISLAVALAACAATESGQPLMPGAVNAPPPPMAAQGDALLTATLWAWQGTQMRDGTRVAPDAPERYTLLFQPGGQVSVRADCNRGSASYLLNGNALSFGPIALTKMLCPPGSRDAEFLRQLGAVAAQSFRGYELTFTLGDGAIMLFTTTRR
jgi:para-nitrobenzyl esterase